MKRAIIIVLDSVGIGALPDAANFGDVGSNTLVNIKKARPETSLPNLCSIGLGNIQGEEIELLGKVDVPKGAFGKMGELSIGKDTTTGHWEIEGIITKEESDYITDCFVEELKAALDEKGFALACDVHKVSKSEILRQLRRSKMQAGA